jgi:hypothetical protein
MPGFYPERMPVDKGATKPSSSVWKKNIKTKRNKKILFG